MPLPEPATRREIHHRLIDMKTYARTDGQYDVEAHLVDAKPFDFTRIAATHPVPAGTPLHDLWIRLTVDDNLVVRQIVAASDVTPFTVCKETEATLAVLVGERIASGWSKLVKERLNGAASCTHLKEMLIPLATTALQGIRALNSQRHAAADRNGVPLKLDSCHAFNKHGEVARRLWPLHYSPREDPTSSQS